jgi:transposase
MVLVRYKDFMSTKTKTQQRGQARVQLPERYQVELRTKSLDQMVPRDHLARQVVSFVDSLDLSELYADIRATKDNVGRAPIDPRILFCLWLYATLEGETSGRRIAVLTERDVIYEYLCGGVSVNYHTICDFRSQQHELLKRVLTDSVAILHHHGLVQLDTIAQDGMRVRASAGGSSFRCQGTLEESRAAARTYLEQLESDDDQKSDENNNGHDAPSRGQKSARERAAREKSQRLQEACEQMKELQKAWDKRNSGKSEEHQRSTPRASTTDPDARRMKMGDGGFRPAYNVQFGSDCDALVIVDVNVEAVGSDAGLLEPMHTRVCEQYNTTPEQWLADGGFSNKDGVTSVERAGTKFFGPVTSEKQILSKGGDPYEPQARDTDEYAAFRVRMKSAAAQETYRRRGAAAEFPNAFCRNHGLSQFRVRGRLKVLAQSLWHALAYNFQRFRNLRVSDTQQSYLELLNNQ